MSKRSRRAKRQNRKKRQKNNMPQNSTLKDFIESFWIKGMRSLLRFNPYMSVFQLGVGIELLGEILDTSNQMGVSGMSREHFEDAIQNISCLNVYSQYIPNPTQNSNQKKINDIRTKSHRLKNAGVITQADETTILNVLSHASVGSITQSSPYDLYAAMRCGMLHNGIPSKDLYLARKMPTEVVRLPNGKWILDVEKLYAHFVDACNDVIGNQDPIVQSRLGQVVFHVTSANAAAQTNLTTVNVAPQASQSVNATAQANQNVNGQISVPTQTQNISNQYTTNTSVQNGSWSSSVTLSGHP